MTFNVITPEAAQTLWVVADRIRLLGGIADSSLELIEVEVPPGSGTPPHSHASPELFYVLEGALAVRHFGAGGPPEVTVAGPGTSVRIGPKAPHNYSNDSDRPVRMLVLVEPSMIAFFRDIGTVEPQAQPDFARIGAAMQRHGIEALPVAA
ncbi:MAG: cupin domain-containing protein [Mesorhizobium sp.]|uniref:cupin domain-containing protein n=1 Tax=Mesorhizobium sp. TaxID=1871066 RepID=UPI000FE54D81|nr:cupin domain-containing protein [Mesorhizobium sp.]RWM06359.1 MAG: cupin domain-containing protein [Mesorhizobium sp.]TIO50010.1 MAG: cupin domain-containing protein [Mesorhizobium sp.]TIO56717.1 MAG: cupin domain-containing protein [Mesorhizobium sp.]TJV61715.1 MAG: cupin domain-containing protein [Mesorhizobium sp.]